MEPSTRFMHGLQVVGGVPSVSLGWMLSTASCCIIASPAAEQRAFTGLPPAHSSMTTLPGEKVAGILLLLLSLTVWKADAVNTFPDGRTEEAYLFLLWKVLLPKFSCSAMSCCSLTASVSESGLRAAKSFLYSMRQMLSLPAWIPIWLQQHMKAVAIYAKICLWYFGA